MEVVLEGEDGELQPAAGGDQLARLREELEERLEDDAGVLKEGERDHRVFDDDEQQDGVLYHQEDVEDPRYLGNERHVEREQRQPPRNPIPPPALEYITLPSGHKDRINLVLMDEGAVCATGSRDSNVKLWDMQVDYGGMLLHTLGGQDHFNTHLGWVWCLASQRPLLASGGFDSAVRLCDLQEGGAERGLIRTEAFVHCLSCQMDMLLAGTFNKMVSMYDTRGEGI
eukprot:superscaffoldBa00000595_g5910